MLTFTQFLLGGEYMLHEMLRGEIPFSPPPFLSTRMSTVYTVLQMSLIDCRVQNEVSKPHLLQENLISLHIQSADRVI